VSIINPKPQIPKIKKLKKAIARGFEVQLANLSIFCSTSARAINIRASQKRMGLAFDVFSRRDYSP